MNMINQILKMIPSSAFDNLHDKLSTIISAKLNEVELNDGERAAVLLIEGTTGYMVNVIRLDENLQMNIVSQTSLSDFIDNILKYVKNGNLG